MAAGQTDKQVSTFVTDRCRTLFRPNLRLLHIDMYHIIKFFTDRSLAQKESASLTPSTLTPCLSAAETCYLIHNINLLLTGTAIAVLLIEHRRRNRKFFGGEHTST